MNPINRTQSVRHSGSKRPNLRWKRGLHSCATNRIRNLAKISVEQPEKLARGVRILLIFRQTRKVITAAEPSVPSPRCSAVRRRGRCQATSSGLSFLRWRTKRQKKGQGVAHALAPGPRIAKGWGCSARSISTCALLFQTLIKMKKGRPVMHVRGRPLEPIGVVSGG